MTPNLPLNGCIYTLTVGGVLMINVSQVNLEPPQSQPTLTFVSGGSRAVAIMHMCQLIPVSKIRRSHVCALQFHPKNTPETISEGQKSRIFLGGGMSPDPPSRRTTHTLIAYWNTPFQNSRSATVC